MIELEPDVDAYGSKARASAIADFVELWAISGTNPSAADVGDYIADVGWAQKLHELYTVPPGGADDSADDLEFGTDGTVAARRVFDVLDERSATLGSHYPFRKDNERCFFTGNASSPYLVPLAIAVAHAYSITTPQVPSVVFEDTVARVLEAHARRAVNFSHIRAQHPAANGGFDAAVIDACRLVGLRGTPTAHNRAVHANDEKVDTIVHLDWGDRRAGAWTMVGQVTCAKSDDWFGKLQEVPAGGWALFLGELIEPQVFLAIPHHIESRHLHNLVGGYRKLVVDRLRIALWLDTVSSSEATIVQSVLSADLAAP